jgi:uncharacterized protein YjbI with pentapeptide repeats
MTGVDLEGCDLTAADLSGADLSDVNLTRANLTDANLSGANLARTLFNSTQLRATDLSECVWNETVLSNTDLTVTRSISSARHERSSSVAVDTIWLAAHGDPRISGVPEPYRSFFVGCGVPPYLLGSSGEDVLGLLRGVTSELSDGSRPARHELRGE